MYKIKERRVEQKIIVFLMYIKFNTSQTYNDIFSNDYSNKKKERLKEDLENLARNRENLFSVVE